MISDSSFLAVVQTQQMNHSSQVSLHRVAGKSLHLYMDLMIYLNLLGWKFVSSLEKVIIYDTF